MKLFLTIFATLFIICTGMTIALLVSDSPACTDVYCADLP